MECQGKCNSHHMCFGEVKKVNVKDIHEDWGNFYYCEQAIEKDKNNGFVITIIQDVGLQKQELFDINTFMDELELLTKKYNIIIDGSVKLKTIGYGEIYGAEGELFWNGICYELK